MRFSRAYKKLMRGKRIFREGWAQWYYLYKPTGDIILHLEDGKEIINESKDLRVTLDDVVAKDWLVCD